MKRVRGHTRYPMPDARYPMPDSERRASSVRPLTLRVVEASPAPLQVPIDEFVEIAIEHPLNVADLDTGAEILDHLVGLEDIGANLAAPSRLSLVTPDQIHVGKLLAPGALGEPGREQCHGPIPVLQLGTLRLARHHETGGKMGDPDSRVGLVDVLATGSR